VISSVSIALPWITPRSRRTILRISQDFLTDKESARDPVSGGPNLAAMSAYAVKQFFHPAMRVAIEATVMWAGRYMRG